jgi:hypothetical protein
VPDINDCGVEDSQNQERVTCVQHNLFTFCEGIAVDVAWQASIAPVPQTRKSRSEPRGVLGGGMAPGFAVKATPADAPA